MGATAGGILGIGGGIFGIFAGMSAADKANEAAMTAADSAAKWRAVKMDQQRGKRNTLFKQTMMKRDLESLKAARVAAKVRGRAKAATASSGLSTGSGSGLQRLAALNVQAGAQQDALSTTTGWSFESIRSDYESGAINSASLMEQQINAAFAQTQSPIMAGLSGGLSGVGTGLGIAGAGWGQGGLFT